MPPGRRYCDDCFRTAVAELDTKLAALFRTAAAAPMFANLPDQRSALLRCANRIDSGEDVTPEEVAACFSQS